MEERDLGPMQNMQDDLKTNWHATHGCCDMTKEKKENCGAEASEKESDMFSRKLFVGNIGYRQNWRDLKDFFGKFGKVNYAQVVFDHLSKKAKGYGFVEFATKEDADACLNALPEELVLEGRTLRVHHAIESKKSTFKIHPPVPSLPNDPDARSQEGTVLEETGEDKSHILTGDEWRIIFSYLTVPELIRLERVCRWWRDMALALWTERRELTLTGFSFKILLTDQVLMSVLQRCSEWLQSLTLSTVSQVLSEYSVSMIGHLCPGLVQLDMTGIPATNIGMRDLTKRIKGLKWIKLHRCTHVAEKGLWWLVKNCQQLEHVDFSDNSSVTGKCFFLLKPTLKCLIANRCYKLTDYSIQQLSKNCCHLRELQIHTCRDLTDIAIRAVMTFSKLEVLDIGGHFPKATPEPWALLGKLSQLTDLKLNLNPHVTDEVVSAIASGCPKMRSLSLSGLRPLLTRNGLSRLGALKDLRSLDLSYIEQVNDSLLELLALNGVLERLFLHTCQKVTETGVRHVLELCGRLCLLDLSNNTSLLRSALSPLTSGRIDRQGRGRLEICISGTTMLLEEQDAGGAPSLEQGLPAWVTLNRVNLTSRLFSHDDTVYLPEPWSDGGNTDYSSDDSLEGGDDLLEVLEALEEEALEAEWRREEARAQAGGSGHDARRPRDGYADVVGGPGAAGLGAGGGRGRGRGNRGGLLDSGEQRVLRRTGDTHQRPTRGGRIGDGVRFPSPRMDPADGDDDDVDGEDAQEEGRRGGDHFQAVGGNLFDGGDNLASGRSAGAKSDDPAPRRETEEEELWEGECVTFPPPVAPRPAVRARPDYFVDIDDDFDEDYDEFLINDDPLEYERWEMS